MHALYRCIALYMRLTNKCFMSLQRIPDTDEIPHLRDSIVKLLQDFQVQVGHYCNAFLLP